MKRADRAAMLRELHGPYWSQQPTIVALDFRCRVEGQPVERRMHLWAGDLRCDPRFCRECWREQHWHQGQTHGEESRDRIDEALSQLQADGLIGSDGRVTGLGYGLAPDAPGKKKGRGSPGPL